MSGSAAIVRHDYHEHRVFGLIHRHEHHHGAEDASRSCSDIRHRHHVTAEDAVAGIATVLHRRPLIPATPPETVTRPAAAAPNPERAPSRGAALTDLDLAAGFRLLSDGLLALAIALEHPPARPPLPLAGAKSLERSERAKRIMAQLQRDPVTGRLLPRAGR